MAVHSRRLLLRPDYTSDSGQTPAPLPQPLPTSTAGLSSSYSPLGLSDLTEDSKMDSSTVATVVVILSVLFLFGLFSIHVRRQGNRSRSVQRHSGLAGPSRPPPPPPPLPRSINLYILKSLPVFPFTGTEKYQNHCAVCLGEYEENECVKLIPFCQHVYHPDCIDRWLYSRSSCPVCRSTRFFKSEFDDSEGKGGGAGMVEERTSQESVSQAGTISTNENLHTCALEVRV